MKKMWNMLRDKARRDNRGMSFVETLCAVAILALVAGVIGTVVVMSTRTYKKGISETGIQQEAQLAANNIGNMVKDACSVVYGESGQQYLENGADLMLNPDNTPKMQSAGFTELSIMTNEDIQYTMTYDEGNSTLMYQEFQADGSALTGTEIMANNIVAFAADTTDFKNSKTIKLNMTVEDKSTNRRIPMEYTMTSRNDAVEGVYVSHADAVVLAFEDSDVVLVPGETYKIPLIVAGDITGLEWVSWGSLDTVSLTLDYAEVRVPVGTTSTSETITVRTKDRDADGNYKATASCNVLIRRVDSVQVTHSVDTTNSKGGMYETAGTVYTFTASVGGNELTKRVAYDYDRNYKTAQAVVWSCVLEVNGTKNTYNWTSAQNGAGQWEFVSPDFTTGAFAEYFEVTSTKEDALAPSFVIKAKKAMPAGLELTVRATSKHACGVNKADSKYYDGLGIDPENIYYGEDTLRPRATKLNQGLEITLEPYQEGKVKLGMKGGLVGEEDLEFDFHDATDLCSSVPEEWSKNAYDTAVGTRVMYDASEDEAVITLGKDEKGSGPEGTTTQSPYTFTIGVKVKGSSEDDTKITVHVRRVDFVKIDAIRNKDDNTTMDLRLRFNADTKVDDRIAYLLDGTNKDDYGLPLTALSTKVTIEVVDKADKVNENLTQVAEWKTYESSSRDKNKENNGVITIIKGSWGKQLKTKDSNGKEKVVYQIENTKPARVSKNGSSWSLEQTPELDIKPMGLGAGEKIRVTMEALHPIGSDNNGKKTNNTTKTYATEVKAVYELKGEEIIGVPKEDEVIIVEPYQVSASGSSGPMIIPLYTASQVGTVKIKLEGQNTSTKLVNDTATGGTNSEWTLPVSGSNTTNLLLNVSPTEEGSTYDGKDGRIKMTLTAYSGATASDDELLDTVTVYLAVRRVTTVDIQNKKAFVNETGKAIELKALASGIQGTEYFDRQVKDRDDKYEPVWDSEGKYKSPYELKWSLYYKDSNGKEKEKEISNSYSEYFKDVSYGSENTDGSGAQTIKFTLTQVLPEGAQIRATSVHAGNKNGKAENRSGLNYVKDIDQYKTNYPEGIVFDYIEIENSLIVADGFKRGKDYTFIKDTDIVNMQQDVLGWWACVNQASFYRYREAGGTWSKYHLMDSGEIYWAVANYVPMSYLFRPDKEYDIEIVSVVYNKTDRLIYWPLDEKLLEKGRGWTEAGFTFWKPTQEQWKKDHPSGSEYYRSYSWYQETYDKVQAFPEVKQTFRIPKSEMSFNPRSDASSYNSMTVSEKVTSVGSASEPIRLNGNNGNETDYSGFIVDLAITGYEMNTDQQCFRTVVQKKSGNQWITLGYDDESKAKNEGFKVDSANPYISIYRTGNAEGVYRVAPVIVTGEKIKWRNVTEVPRSNHTDMDILFSPEYTTTEENYHLYNYDTGKYVIYFEFYR